jgi:hypothetical protein
MWDKITESMHQDYHNIVMSFNDPIIYKWFIYVFIGGLALCFFFEVFSENDEEERFY